MEMTQFMNLHLSLAMTDGASIGLIVGVSVGVILIVAIVVGVVIVMRRMKAKSAYERGTANKKDPEVHIPLSEAKRNNILDVLFYIYITSYFT